MRFAKPILAVVVALLLNLAGPLLTTSSQAIIPSNTASVTTGGMAYAATDNPQTQQEVCKDHKNNANEFEACKVGFTAGTHNEPRTQACDTYSGAQETACLDGFDGYFAVGAGPPNDGAGDLGVADAGDPPECNNGDFSWFICSTMEWIQGVVTYVEKNVIAPLLDTPSLTFEGPIYEIWNVMRGLADVCFVLVFMWLVIANTTSINIQVYHIRKMLPKLVTAVLLVQASYLLAALAVDVSNVLGRGIFDLINGLVPEYSGNISGTEVGVSYGIGLTAVVAGALALAGSIASGTIFLVMLGALVGVIMTFLTLVLRQIVLTLLIITFPLAIVAWILPNTEEFAEEWAELFMKLLLMYPIVMLIFAAGKIFSVAASAAAGTKEMGPTFALVGLVAPLFLIPLAFNLAGTLFRSSRNIMLHAAGKAHKGVSESIKDSKAMENYRGRRTDAGVAAIGATDARLDEWQKSGGPGKRLIANHRKALLLAQAGRHGDLGLAGHYGREKSNQDEISRIGKDLTAMNLGRPDYEKLAGATKKDDLPAKLRPYYSMAGQAAALRYLHKEKALDESGHVSRDLLNMQDRERAEKIRSLAMQGEGGVMWVAEPAYAAGGLDGKKLLKPDSGAKIKSNWLATLMTSTDALERNFGMNTSNDPSVRTRRLGKLDADGNVTTTLHYMERELDHHNLVGGAALSMTGDTLKTALTGRFAGDSNAAGRRRMKELLTNTQAQQRITVLESYANSLQAHGYHTQATEVRRSVKNLKDLRDVATTNIHD
jgi:hypothetical protein